MHFSALQQFTCRYSNVLLAPGDICLNSCDKFVMITLVLILQNAIEVPSLVRHRKKLQALERARIVERSRYIGF